MNTESDSTWQWVNCLQPWDKEHYVRDLSRLRYSMSVEFCGFPLFVEYAQACYASFCFRLQQFTLMLAFMCVYVWLCVEPFSRSKDNVRSWIKIGSALRLHICVTKCSWNEGYMLLGDILLFFCLKKKNCLALFCFVFPLRMYFWWS